MPWLSRLNEDHTTEKCSRPFQQPPPFDLNSVVVNRTTGETLSQRQTRLESNFRNETADLNARFQESEQERDRAWRKLLKTKAEFDGGRRRFDPTLMPLPSLRSSGMVANSCRDSSCCSSCNLRAAKPHVCGS